LWLYHGVPKHSKECIKTGSDRPSGAGVGGEKKTGGDAGGRGSEQKILKAVNDMEGVVFASNRLDEAGCRDTSAVPNENQRLYLPGVGEHVGS
jgi:hypothetical protein